MNKQIQRGFIPLVAIILLGLIAIAGGTIATVSISRSNTELRPTATTTTEWADLAPVSARVESLEASEGFTQDKVEVTTPEAFDDSEAKAICAEVMEQEVPGTPSLIGQIHALCEKIHTKDQGVDLEYTANVLKEKWELWQRTQEAQSQR